MRIAVDLDDTIWDLLPAWLDFINRKYHLYITEDEIIQWDLTECINQISADEIYAPLKDKNLWKSVQPKPDAMVYLPYIRSLGHEIIFVTSSSPISYYYKIEYLFKKYFNAFPVSSVICAKDKSLIKADVLIDDAIHNVESFPCFRILLNTKSNRQPVDESIHRVDNWAQIYKLIKEIEN